jgi:hypothetical protein
MTDREIMQQALDALEIAEVDGNCYYEVTELLRIRLAQLEQEPVDFTSLLSEAEEIVQGKPTWKRFIDGTPLANDIAVWMTVFAQDVARRDAPPAAQPSTEVKP